MVINITIIITLRCNLFETASASEWTLYISEWHPAPGGGLPLSNIRVTTKVSILTTKQFYVNILLNFTQVYQLTYGSVMYHSFFLPVLDIEYFKEAALCSLR